MSALGWKKKRQHFEKNEINDGESPLVDTPAGPSGVFINSSQIQLVGLFVRRFSLTSPSYIALLYPTLYPFSVLSCTLSLFSSTILASFLLARKHRL